MTSRFLPILLLVSGFTALVYQVLWARQLGLLFGNAADAAAATLAVFFLGLAAGSRAWGGRAEGSPSPLRDYGLLEIGIALAVLPYFGLLALYRSLYSPLYAILGEMPAGLLIAKLLLALLLLGPPAFLMGGTLPLMGQQLIRAGRELGRKGTFLYAVNTAGAALGAVVAGFFLPPWLGYRNTYLVAVALNLGIGVVAIAVARREAIAGGEGNAPAAKSGARPGRATPRGQPTSRGKKGKAGREDLPVPLLLAVAFLSGFLVLALEVLWTRMFAQVLQNSVYTFAAVLTVVLVALAAGSMLANLLSRLAASPTIVLGSLCAAAGFAALATAWLFYDVTGGMGYLASGEAWEIYVASIFSGTALVLLVPGTVVGALFPYLLRIAESWRRAPGRILGDLGAINTLGAILGSLCASFLLMRWLGMWGGLGWLAAAYFLLAFFVVPRRGAGWAVQAVAALGLLLLLGPGSPERLPLVRIDPDERILDTWEGPDGVVAVIEREGERRIKVNNHYALGGTGAVQHEQNQSLIPLLSQPSLGSVFYLGLGTGITAGASLMLPVERVVVTELVPEVVTAARAWFAEHANGLYSDPRVTILSRDGRNHLAGTDERYDAILADLFIPWRAGVGSLYTGEHFEAARERLRPGGIFVQWIPLYQVTDSEFFAIARTLLDVFPDVLVWRGDFFPNKPILALVASVDPPRLDPATLLANGAWMRGEPVERAPFLAVTLPFYAGNLGAARGIVPEGPLNTDDHPLVEFTAPISHRQVRGGRAEWFTGRRLLAFYDALLTEVPPGRDPYLARLTPDEMGFVIGGNRYYAGRVLQELGEEERARVLLAEFAALVPPELVMEMSPERTSTEVEE